MRCFLPLIHFNCIWPILLAETILYISFITGSSSSAPVKCSELGGPDFLAIGLSIRIKMEYAIETETR